MLQNESIIRVIDNSGAKSIKCIKILKGFKKRYSYTGDTIVVSVKKLRSKNKDRIKIKKGEVLKAIIVRTKQNKKRKDGSYFWFYSNGAILINSQNKPIGTRIYGPVPKEFKSKKLIKVASLATGFI